MVFIFLAYFTLYNGLPRKHFKITSWIKEQRATDCSETWLLGGLLCALIVA